MTANPLKFTLSSTQPSAVVRAIAQQINVEVVEDCDQYRMELPKHIGSGTIAGVDFYEGYGLLTCNAVLKKDMDLHYSKGSNHPLRFIFCLEGSLIHFVSNIAIQYQLNPLLGSITTIPKASSQSFRFMAGTNLKLASLVINRNDFINKVECSIETLPNQLQQVFKDTKARTTFLYEGNYSIASAECIKKIFDSRYSGMVNMTYLESKALELLTFQLKQYLDDQKPSSRQVLLRKYDVDKIIEAKETIINNLRDAPTIKELAKMVGLNQSKLKQGFKHIFDATINQYLRSQRLEAAKLLLMEDSKSIQEVAELVGYQNKSHFARRFKEKYGVLPRDFAKSLKSRLK